MQLSLVREIHTNVSTIGRLYIDGKYVCDTLEDTVRPEGVKVYGQTAIPKGVYEVILDYSNKYKRIMPHILDVPMFEGIRIHSGNSASDSEGCILVGIKSSTNWVKDSRVTYNKLFEKLETAFEANDKITITIT